MDFIQGLQETISKEDILETQTYLASYLTPTPLIPLNIDLPNRKVYLKLENLSPIGCFKMRSGLNCLRHFTKDELNEGVYTASAGNFAQGLLWACKKKDVSATILVPDSAPSTKLGAIERLGGTVIKLPYKEWWNVIESHAYPGMKGKFIHPVCNRNIILGNTTIGKEIYDQLPEVDTVVVTYGGGALSIGIGSAFKVFKPQVKVIVCEHESSSPLTAAFKAGAPVETEYKPSFIDGVGSHMVLPPMYDLARRTIDDTVVVQLDAVASAVKSLVERNRVVAEGAGAATVAAAMEGLVGDGNIVCIISGGNIDTQNLITILNGGTPQKL